jgi:nucleoside-triphosphatase
MTQISLKAKNILLTGLPRCGKSTLIQKIVQRGRRPMTGFFTSEIRDRGKRVGFSITTLDGKNGILAHIRFRGPLRVGKYGVNIEEFERIAIPSMRPSQPNEVIVIDEIGKMECLSRIFKETLIQALDSNHRTIASIALKGGLFIRHIKERKDVTLILLTEKNRDQLLDLLSQAA